MGFRGMKFEDLLDYSKKIARDVIDGKLAYSNAILAVCSSLYCNERYAESCLDSWIEKERARKAPMTEARVREEKSWLDEPYEVPQCLLDLPKELFDDEGNQLYNCADELSLDWNERYDIEHFIEWFGKMFGGKPTNRDHQALVKYWYKYKDAHPNEFYY